VVRRELNELQVRRNNDSASPGSPRRASTDVASPGASTGTFMRPRLVERAPPGASLRVATGSVSDAQEQRPESRLPPANRSGRSLDEMLLRVAPSRVSVLITGETGVGKDILARRIHRASPRAHRPFVTVNCAAFCESLLDSELFGHLRGAFTGADQSRAGLIEAADGGTVFLDELGELSASAQAKLLRVIETRFVTRVGATTSHLVDVRFLAATHRDLDAAILKGQFRADLLYRLEGIRLTLPPLRERTEEILPATGQFLDELAARDGIRRPTLSPDAERALLHHPWPGNFRELRNVMDRAALICEGGVIKPDDLLIAGLELGPDGNRASECSAPATSFQVLRSSPRAALDTDETSSQTPESTRILTALNTCAGNQTRAAKLLGMSRRTFITRLEQHGIARPRARRLRPM
jgi:two-component system, NtrC family, response regulator AtoC